MTDDTNDSPPGDDARAEVLDEIGFYIGVTGMFMPVVAAITALVAVVLGVARPVSALVALIIVTIQTIGLLSEHWRGPGWKELHRVAWLPFAIDEEVVVRAARFRILARPVMFVGATIAFWWPTVVLAATDRLLLGAA